MEQLEGRGAALQQDKLKLHRFLEQRKEEIGQQSEEIIKQQDRILLLNTEVGQAQAKALDARRAQDRAEHESLYLKQVRAVFSSCSAKRRQ